MCIDQSVITNHKTGDVIKMANKELRHRELIGRMGKLIKRSTRRKTDNSSSVKFGASSKPDDEFRYLS